MTENAEAPVDPVAAAIAAQDAGEQPLTSMPADTTLEVPAEQTSEQQSEELLLGKFKSVDALAEAYQNSEKRMHEAIQREKELQQREAELAQIAEQYQQVQQPEFGTPQSADELIDLAYTNPQDAMAFAADNAPHLVPNVIASIRDHDPALAEMYADQWFEYKLEQRLQGVIQPVQQQAKQQQVEQAYNRAKQLPGWDTPEVKAGITQFVQQNQALFAGQQDATGLYNALETAYYTTIGRNPQIAEQAQAAMQQALNQGDGGIIESQTAGSGINLGQADPVQDFKSEILAINQRGKF